MIEHKKEKRVVLINRSIYVPGEGGYKRTMYLFDMMRNLGHHPILLTSDFNHYNKTKRNIEEFRKSYPTYRDIIFLHISAYKKNISMKRYLAEKEWKNAVKKWVQRNAHKIDTVMLSMPEMDTILAIKDICRDNDIEMVVDVRDLSPEAFRVILKNEYLYKTLTYGMKKKADKAYSCADKLFAVSEEYLKRGLQANKKAEISEYVYIGCALDLFDSGVKEFSNDIIKPENEIWVTYAGTLGTSYDLITLIEAANILRNQEFDGKKIRVMILGQGPDKEFLQKYAEQIGASNVTFVGFVDYPQMAAYLSKSDMTINAVKKRASQSIINKVSDYFAAGIPMLNGCTCKEQQDMVEKYNVGLNYEPENVKSLTKAITMLASNLNRSLKYGKNARKLAEDKFDRNKTYISIIDALYGK